MLRLRSEYELTGLLVAPIVRRFAWRYASVLCLSGALGACVPESIAETGALLNEFAVVALPDDFAPIGAIVGEDSTALVWSHDGRMLLTRPDDTAHVFFGNVERDRPIAAAFIDDSTFQVVDTLRRSIVTYRGTRLLFEKPYALLGQSPRSAALAATGWLVVTADSADTWHVRPLESASGEPPAQLHPVETERRLRGADVILTSDDGGVLVSVRTPPYALLRADRRGRTEVLRSKWPPELTALLQADTTSAWIVASTVTFGEGLVQTLADLRSDARLIVTCSRRGRPLRHTALEAPFAFAASSERAKIVLGFRGSLGQEIVFYGATGQTSRSETASDADKQGSSSRSRTTDATP